MAPSCSTSASASGTGVVSSTSLAHLLQGPDAAPPGYLTLSLTPAGEVQRQPGEVTLEHVDAPHDYLKLTPPDDDEPGPDAAGASSGGSVVEEAGSAASSSSGVAETALVIGDAIAPPADIAGNVLPPKKRKFAACVCQETPGTSAAASSSSSRPSSLAIVIHGGNDGETRSKAAMDGQPIDAVPLQAVCLRGRVRRPLRLSGGAGGITAKHAASTSSNTAAAPFSTDPIGAVPLRAAWCPYVPLAAGAASGHHPGPPEQSWTRIRADLGLPPDHSLHFIAHKRVERSDLELQQSRLLIPRGGAARFIPLLSDDSRRAANLEGPWKRPKRETPGINSDISDEKKARAQGKKHGGLVVPVYINRAGDRMDAQLTRWTSNGNTVLKFGIHKGFVDASGLRAMDEIQIWAFQNPGLCLVTTKIAGGETMTAPSAAEGGQQSKPPAIG